VTWRPGRRALVAGAAAVVVVAAGIGLAAAGRPGAAGGSGADPGPVVVVADERGQELARAPLPASGRFALSYRHSVYRAEVTETFAADGDRFRLVAVASPSEAVLDYYELAGRRRPEGGGWLLEPVATPQMASLPLIASERGRRTLVVDGRRLPLYRPGEPPVRVLLSVRG
jgi:uncharacterized protein DUF1850